MLFRFMLVQLCAGTIGSGAFALTRNAGFSFWVSGTVVWGSVALGVFVR